MSTTAETMQDLQHELQELSDEIDELIRDRRSDVRSGVIWVVIYFLLLIGSAIAGVWIGVVLLDSSQQVQRDIGLGVMIGSTTGLIVIIATQLMNVLIRTIESFSRDSANLGGLRRTAACWAEAERALVDGDAERAVDLLRDVEVGLEVARGGGSLAREDEIFRIGFSIEKRLDLLISLVGAIAERGAPDLGGEGNDHPASN